MNNLFMFLPPRILPSTPTELAIESKSSIDLKSLNELLQREDFKTIVKDKNLFWANFCKTFAEKKDKSDESCFDVRVVKNQAFFIGGKHIILAVKEQVEIFRQLALEVFETRCEVNRVIVFITDSLFLRKPSPNPIDLTDWLNRNVKGKIINPWFRDLVSPYLHDFFESLALDYFESKTTQLAQTNSAPDLKEATAIRIVLKRDRDFTYPIAPATIPAVSHPDHSFYERYKLEPV